MSVAQKEIVLKELEMIPDEFLNEVVQLLRSFRAAAIGSISKMDAMKLAANDPIYLQDLKDSQQDFSAVDYEML